MDDSNDALLPVVWRMASPLPKPRIPDADDGGLGYDDILRIPDRNLSVDVGPWDGFEDGDTVRVLVGPDQRIFGTAPASADDKYGTVTVVVPARNFSFLADGTYEVVAQVVNQLGVPVASPPEPIRLKLSVPGGLDPVADTTHRNENLAAPTVEPMLIDKDTPAATVTVPAWDNIDAGDRLILRWGLAGNETTFDVTDPAAPVPPFTVDRAMIDKGGSGSKVEVTYHIFDLVGNWSLFAPPTNVDVEAPDALPPPWVAPTVGDAGEVIDVPALAGGDATAEVHGGLQLGDVVTVKFLGTTAEGSATEYTPPPQTVTVAGRPLLFVLPNRLFPPLIQGTCAVGYTAVRGGASLPPSSLRRLAVTGETAQLAPPSVDEAIGDTLDPAHVPNGAHASVAADPLIAPGTRVTLEMYGTSTGNVPVGHQDYRDIGDSTPFPLRFLIPAGKIVLLAGSSATFAYTVDTFLALDDGRRLRREGRGTVPSPERTYRILGSSVSLPPPTVPEAEDGRLDPAKVDPLIGVRVDVDDVVANDRVTVSWIGTKYTTPYTETLTAHGPRVSFFVPKTPFVDANVDADVNVDYTVEGKGRSDPLTLHIGAGLAVPAITGVRDSSGNAVVNGGSTEDTTLTLSGTAQPNQQVEIFDGPTSKGTATVNANGEWSFTVSGLAVAMHTFSAQGRYGSNPMSKIWVVVVSQSLTPAITGVRDSSGNAVANGASTTDTTLTLSGTAQPNEQVEIFDGATSKGSAAVNGSGQWTKTLSGLAVASHSFTAKARYGSNPVSTPWVVTVTQLIAPAITGVRDSSGNAVANGGSTTDTTLTLSGTAQPNQQVDIFDGATSKGSAAVNGSGQWTKTLSGLAVAAHSFTAKASYGSNPVSTPWVVTVTQLIAPAITGVRDSSGDVANGGSTTDTTLTLSGTAQPNEQVEILDGTSSKGTASVNGAGEWSKTLSGLAVAWHSFTAKASYGSNPVSTAWVVNVTQLVTPAITGVRDSRGNAVANGGSTSDTTLTLSGNAQPNQQVEIFDGSTSKGNAAVNANGEWSKTLSGLAVGAHSFKARGLYGSNPESTVWRVTVQQPLTVDPSPVTLPGLSFAWSDPGLPLSPVWYENTFVDRPASGGSPPYTYTSSNTDVARVSAEGLVRARRNGTATITVKDSGNQTASYSVTVTNAWIMEYIGNFIWNGAIAYQRPGGHLPTGDEMNWKIRPYWAPAWPRQELVWWTSDARSNDALTVNVSTGYAEYSLKAFAYPSLSVYR